MIKSLKEKLPKDTWHHCNHGLNDDPRPSLSHPNTRLSTKYNGGTKLLKGLKHSKDLWVNLGVDNSWLLANLQNKNTCLFFKTHITTHFQNNFQKHWKLFKRHTPLYTSKHGSLQRLPPHWPLFKTFFKPTHSSTI